MTLLPDKLFFRIGEVSQLVGVKPHVLRYWESEFPVLRPKKTRGQHRHYARRDVEVALLIKRLVHDQGYTIAGARRKLRELGQHRRSDPSPAEEARHVTLRAELIAVRDRLEDFLEELEEHGAAREIHATVEQVVPVSATPRSRGSLR